MSIKLVCGCWIEDYYDSVPVRIKSESLEPLVGFSPAVEFFEVCKDCYKKEYSKHPDRITSDEEEEEHLSQHWGE